MQTYSILTVQAESLHFPFVIMAAHSPTLSPSPLLQFSTSKSQVSPFAHSQVPPLFWPPIQEFASTSSLMKSFVVSSIMEARTALPSFAHSLLALFQFCFSLTTRKQFPFPSCSKPLIVQTSGIAVVSTVVEASVGSGVDPSVVGSSVGSGVDPSVVGSSVGS